MRDFRQKESLPHFSSPPLLTSSYGCWTKKRSGGWVSQVNVGSGAGMEKGKVRGSEQKQIHSVWGKTAQESFNL